MTNGRAGWLTAALLMLVVSVFVQLPLELATAARRAPAARSEIPPKSNAKSGSAVVTAEVAQVYDQPDLDAKAITVVKRGTKLPISKGTRGAYAKFYRTRANGKVGWILTLDVKSEAEAKKFFAQGKAARYKRGPFAPEPDEAGGQRGRDREMFTFTRSVSLAIGMNEYKESINGVDYTANLLTYGLKLTGPDVLLTGPLMGVDIVFHYGAPSYYDSLSQVKPSGFIMWTDANLLLPIMARQDTLIGIGAGPILVISNIQASQGGKDYGMWAINIGADIELSAGVRFDDFCVRLDGKYIFEKKIYRQVQLSVGTIF